MASRSPGQGVGEEIPDGLEPNHRPGDVLPHGQCHLGGGTKGMLGPKDLWVPTPLGPFSISVCKLHVKYK